MGDAVTPPWHIVGQLRASKTGFSGSWFQHRGVSAASRGLPSFCAFQYGERFFDITHSGSCWWFLGAAGGGDICTALHSSAPPTFPYCHQHRPVWPYASIASAAYLLLGSVDEFRNAWYASRLAFVAVGPVLRGPACSRKTDLRWTKKFSNRAGIAVMLRSVVVAAGGGSVRLPPELCLSSSL